MQKNSIITFLVAAIISAVAAQNSSTPDGTCGGTNGFTCTTPEFGNCCSSAGYCGNTAAHCGGGCQASYGTCSGGSESPDGSCGGTTGYVCHHDVGDCCSGSGFCGNSTAYCGANCQTAYSLTGACLTTGIPSVDGTCGSTNGYTCTGGAYDGMCCSQYGYCGTTAAHCSTLAGCQSGYGANCTTP